MTDGSVGHGQKGLVSAGRHQESRSRFMRIKAPVCASFQSQAPANRQGIDAFVEAPPGKALGVFDGVTVL
jgi:hypothetical protein